MFLAPSSSRAVDPYLQTLLLRISLSRLGGKHRHSPRAKITARDIEMAPKKNKSKLDVEEVDDLSTGWRKCKMSEAAVQELEDMMLLVKV